MPVLVFANGEIEAYDWIRPLLERADLVVAADGGAGHLQHLGRLPDLVVGDQDSISPTVAKWLAEGNVPVEQHAAEKDETDLELALLYAVEHTDDTIVVLGAFGGRADQFLSNILLLMHPALRRRPVELRSRFQRLWLIGPAQGSVTLVGRAGDRVSLIPYGSDVIVRATTGLQWPLRHETLALGPARGVSNVMTGDEATVAVDAGYLICVHTDARWGR